MWTELRMFTNEIAWIIAVERLTVAINKIILKLWNSQHAKIVPNTKKREADILYNSPNLYEKCFKS